MITINIIFVVIIIIVNVELTGGKYIQFETGKLAKQAHGSCVVRMADNVILGTSNSYAAPLEYYVEDVSAVRGIDYEDPGSSSASHWVENPPRSTVTST